MAHDDFYTRDKIYVCSSGYFEGGIYVWSDKQEMAVRMGKTGNLYPVSEQKIEQNKKHYHNVIQPRNFRLLVFNNFTFYINGNMDSHITKAHLITLTFPYWFSIKDCQKETQQFLWKRLGNKYSKSDKEFKYIVVWEFGKYNDRLHCHIIITAIDDNIKNASVIYRKAWDSSRNLHGLGTINVKSITSQYGDLERLCYYLTKDWNKDDDRFCVPKNIEEKENKKPRRYTCSQNCEKPKVPKANLFPIRFYQNLIKCNTNIIKELLNQIYPNLNIKSVDRVYNPYTGGWIFRFNGVRKSIPKNVWREINICPKPTAIYQDGKIIDTHTGNEISQDQLDAIKSFALHYGGHGITIFNEFGDIIFDV